MDFGLKQPCMISWFVRERKNNYSLKGAGAKTSFAVGHSQGKHQILLNIIDVCLGLATETFVVLNLNCS